MSLSTTITIKTTLYHVFLAFQVCVHVFTFFACSSYIMDQYQQQEQPPQHHHHHHHHHSENTISQIFSSSLHGTTMTMTYIAATMKSVTMHMVNIGDYLWRQLWQQHQQYVTLDAAMFILHAICVWTDMVYKTLSGHMVRFLENVCSTCVHDIPQCVSDGVYQCILTSIASPAYELFLHGPTWLWCLGGMHAFDACAMFTSVPAHHWMVHSDECMDILQRQFMQRLVVVVFFTHCVVVAHILMRLVSFVLSTLWNFFFYIQHGCCCEWIKKMFPPLHHPPINKKTKKKKKSAKHTKPSFFLSLFTSPSSIFFFSSFLSLSLVCVCQVKKKIKCDVGTKTTTTTKACLPFAHV